MSSLGEIIAAYTESQLSQNARSIGEISPSPSRCAAYPQFMGKKKGRPTKGRPNVWSRQWESSPRPSGDTRGYPPNDEAPARNVNRLVDVRMLGAEMKLGVFRERVVIPSVAAFLHDNVHAHHIRLVCDVGSVGRGHCASYPRPVGSPTASGDRTRSGERPKPWRA